MTSLRAATGTALIGVTDMDDDTLAAIEGVAKQASVDEHLFRELPTDTLRELRAEYDARYRAARDSHTDTPPLEKIRITNRLNLIEDELLSRGEHAGTEPTNP